MSCYGRTHFCAHLALCLSILAICASPSKAQHPPQWARAGGSATPPVARLDSILAHAQGILLVGNQYIAPPLAMRVQDGQLLVNDVPISSEPASIEPSGNRPHQRRWPMSPDFQAYHRGQQIAGHLETAQVVVALENQPLVLLSLPNDQIDLLRKLARLEAAAAVRPVGIGERLPTNLDRAVWDRWLAEFQPTPEFVARARERIELYERTEREAHAAAAATRRLNDWSYPLSLIGMVTAVLGFGHLLSHRPPVGARSLDIDNSPLALGVLTWSLVLVVLYSALDLTWTILAFQAGQMRELNPLGSHFIEDPIQLIAFKAGATAISVGLLFCLRKYCKAQLAAWWICLILTLLTARWLMMSPMMVA
jgi:hypothetical protein